jgi:hypothetical protein
VSETRRHHRFEDVPSPATLYPEPEPRARDRPPPQPEMS